MEHDLRKFIASFLTVIPILFILTSCATPKLAPYKHSICEALNSPDIVVVSVDRYDYICGNYEGPPDLTSIFATIRNKGGNVKKRWFETAPTMKLRIELSGSGISTSSWSREVVVPSCLHDTRVEIQEVAPGYPGTVKVRIVADYENQVTEGNETNNELEIELPRRFPSDQMQCGGS